MSTKHTKSSAKVSNRDINRIERDDVGSPSLSESELGSVSGGTRPDVLEDLSRKREHFGTGG